MEDKRKPGATPSQKWLNTFEDVGIKVWYPNSKLGIFLFPYSFKHSKDKEIKDCVAFAPIIKGKEGNMIWQYRKIHFKRPMKQITEYSVVSVPKSVAGEFVNEFLRIVGMSKEAVTAGLESKEEKDKVKEEQELQARLKRMGIT